VTRTRLALVCLLTLGALTASVASAQACTDSWKNPVSGSWGTAADWSTGEVPFTTDEVCITVPGTYTVTLAPYFISHEHLPGAEQAGDKVKSLTLGGSSGAQTLDILGQASVSRSNEATNFTELELNGVATINETGTLILEATEGSYAGNHEKPGGSATIAKGSIVNNGHIDSEVKESVWPNELQSSLTNEAKGSVQVSSGTLNQELQFGTSTVNHGLVTVDPGAQWYLAQGSSFVNESDGTVAPEIASASSFGTFQMSGACCDGPGTFTAGGTLLPVLVGGFLPAVNQEFQSFSLTGGKFTGTFATVGNDFSGDYSNKEASPAFVGVIYAETPSGSGSAAGGGSTSGSGTGVKGPAPTPTPVAQVGSISGGHGNLTVTLSCPAGGAACSAATVQATVTEHLKGSKVTAISAKKKKSAAKTRQVVIASGGASLAAGASETLTFKLNGAGSALLAKYGKLTAKVTVSAGGKTLDTATVMVQKAKKPKQKK